LYAFRNGFEPKRKIHNGFQIIERLESVVKNSWRRRKNILAAQPLITANGICTPLILQGLCLPLHPLHAGQGFLAGRSRFS